jgi:hypothetical protein
VTCNARRKRSAAGTSKFECIMMLCALTSTTELKTWHYPRRLFHQCPDRIPGTQCSTLSAAGTAIHPAMLHQCPVALQVDARSSTSRITASRRPLCWPQYSTMLLHAFGLLYNPHMLTVQAWPLTGAARPLSSSCPCRICTETSRQIVVLLLGTWLGWSCTQEVSMTWAPMTGHMPSGFDNPGGIGGMWCFSRE